MHDNFEALLLLLLRAYTTQGDTSSPSLASSDTVDLGISDHALDTLSSEQVSALITSNSVNYEVIQHILSQQKMRPGSKRGMSPPSLSMPSLSPKGIVMDAMGANMSSMSEAVQREGSVGPASPLSPVTPTGGTNVVHLNVLGADKQQPKIEISSEQLNVLQTQVHGLLQSQNISLPSHVSSELVQMLLLRQLQAGGVTSIPSQPSAALTSVPVDSSAERTTVSSSSTVAADKTASSSVTTFEKTTIPSHSTAEKMSIPTSSVTEAAEKTPNTSPTEENVSFPSSTVATSAGDHSGDHSGDTVEEEGGRSQRAECGRERAMRSSQMIVRV